MSVLMALGIALIASFVVWFCIIMWGLPQVVVKIAATVAILIAGAWLIALVVQGPPGVSPPPAVEIVE